MSLLKFRYVQIQSGVNVSVSVITISHQVALLFLFLFTIIADNLLVGTYVTIVYFRNCTSLVRPSGLPIEASKLLKAPNVQRSVNSATNHA